MVHIWVSDVREALSIAVADVACFQILSKKVVSLIVNFILLDCSSPGVLLLDVKL